MGMKGRADALSRVAGIELFFYDPDGLWYSMKCSVDSLWLCAEGCMKITDFVVLFFLFIFSG